MDSYDVVIIGTGAGDGTLARHLAPSGKRILLLEDASERAVGRVRELVLALWVDEAYRYLQLFTGDPLPDVTRRSIAVEPMTCPPNAFRSGEAVIRLVPGGSRTSEWGLSPS
jgi:choline dehydrogenase-like flavoprotein